MTPPQKRYERVLAAELGVGDLVARTRSHEFAEVRQVRHGPKAVSLYLADSEGSWRARPLLTAKWWRVIR